MLMMQESLPNIKSFFRNVEMSSSVRSMVVRFMIAILIRHGRNSSMHAASVIHDQPRHRAQPGRFLQRVRWRAMNILAQVVAMLLRSEKWVGQYLLIVDSTMVGHQGQSLENTYSTGNRKRRPEKNRRYSKYKHAVKGCHCLVFGLLITPEGLRAPFYKPLYTKQHAKEHGLKHRTQAQLGAMIVDELPVPDGVSVTVLGDTAFDARIMRAACDQRGFRWIFPVNANRVLAGPKGKRKRVSSRINELSIKGFQSIRISAIGGKYASQRRLSCHRANAKRKTRTYYVCSEIREVHSVGRVRLVFSSTQEITKKAKRDSTKMLMTNATDLTAREVVELYTLRWQIELFFKELKSTLGLHQYQFKRFQAVEGWIEIVLITFVYLEWTRAKKLEDRRLGKEAKETWLHQRAYGIRQAVLVGIEVRQQIWIGNRLKTPHGRRTIVKSITALLSREYRCVA